MVLCDGVSGNGEFEGSSECTMHVIIIDRYYV